MKNLVIVGKGGFASELIDYINNDEFKIKCFIEIYLKEDKTEIYFYKSLDDNEKSIYEFDKKDFFVIALGDVNLRRKIITYLKTKNVKFANIIHKSAYINSSSILGEGLIISPFSIVNANARLKDFCTLNVYCSVGHDSELGENAVLSPYSSLNGNVKTGKDLFMGAMSTILPKVIVSDNCIISAGTILKKNLDNNQIVFSDSKNKILKIREVPKT